MDSLPEPDRCKRRFFLYWSIASTLLIVGVFFLGLFLTKRDTFDHFLSPIIQKSDVNGQRKEVFGFAPHWNLSKLGNIDWNVLTSFAYFSLDVNADGSISRDTYEWDTFQSDRVSSLFNTAKQKGVKRIVTLTQMEAPIIHEFLDNPSAWENLANQSAQLLQEKDLEGINIDIEYIPSDDHYRQQFSDFMTQYTKIVKVKRPKSFITVSVLASSVRYNKIYDIGHLSNVTDGVLMMAYDFYYAGSEAAGPTAPLYGYNNGKGPYWYDIATAVDDFTKVADPGKIILAVPYYGWDYPTSSPAPLADRWGRTTATTNEKAQAQNLIRVTPVGGWDDQAKVSWRGYYDEDGWHVVYLEDKKSLSYKYSFIKSKSLQGVGIWALGYDNGDEDLWLTLKEQFSTDDNNLAFLEGNK